MIYFQKKSTSGVSENKRGAYAVREEERKTDERKSSRKYVQSTEARIYARADSNAAKSTKETCCLVFRRYCKCDIIKKR